MAWKKILRYILLTLAGLIGFVILFVMASVAPVDRTPARELLYFTKMMARLDTLELRTESGQGFFVGFGKTNITPSEPIATAGYGKRRGQPYHLVHDSIYVRAMVVGNGSTRVAIVTADLLIMPPTVTKALEEKLPSIGFSLNNTYLSATHSHNSIGNWSEGAAKIIYGDYQDSLVQFIADGIVSSIQRAAQNVLPAQLKSGAIAIPRAVKNRLHDNGPEDPFLRTIEVHRSDSTKLLLMSYTAHATCLSQGTLELSRDYPGMLVDELEEKDYDFAMFLAGSVGSHKGSAPVNDWSCMAWMATEVSTTFMEERHTLQPVNGYVLGMSAVPLSLGIPQVKISEDWKVRAWLFRLAFGEYNAFLTVLRIGDVVMLGTPCDFSGELNASLDSVANRNGLRAIVTSFNGGYIGYVTPGKYYDVDHYETRLMNWYAPGTGEYIRDCLAKLILAVSDTK